MNRPMIATAAVLLLAAFVPAANGYHLLDYIADSDPDPLATATTADPDGGGDLHTNDFILQGALIICESNGGDDAGTGINPGTPDDLNPSALGGDSVLFGTGGLCYTGENAVTGVAGPGSEATASGGNYVKLDACRHVMEERGVTPCNTYDATSGFGWTARIGIFECFIPTYNNADAAVTNVADTTFAEVDWALYYDRLYAFWSYEVDPDPATGNWIQLGDGWYTDPADGSDGTDNNDAATNAFNAGDPDDNEDYFHGHAAMFVDATASNQQASLLSGSAYTDGPATGASLKTAIDAMITAEFGATGMVINGVAAASDFHWSSDGWDNQLVESDGATLGAGTVDTENTGGTFWDNDCGASPACPTTTIDLTLVNSVTSRTNPGAPADDQVDPTDPVVDELISHCDAPYGPVVRGPSADI